MLEEYRERAPTTSVIKSILDSYPSGMSILRELLQNSDDAGATSQTFILDRRKHAAETLLDPVLKATQGPALLAANNAGFSEKNWKALTTIHGSSKTADETQIGKYGLGFRSCYHLTDNPHILSGQYLAILDPHEKFTAQPGGTRYDFVKYPGNYPDQLGAFQPFISETITPFSGAIIRLPLRTEEQALHSDIKKTVVTADEIYNMFLDFIKNELAVALLFLKHVSVIELREISASNEQTLVGRVKITNIDDISHQRSFHRFEEKLETFRCFLQVHDGEEETTTEWRVLHAVGNTEATAATLSARLGYVIRDRLVRDKLYSHVALAIPIHEALVSKARLFTLLPLPIFPKDFPLHVHGMFALTPDRQNLRNEQEIGMGKESRERLLVEWNKTIFDTFVPKAWARLLDVLVKVDKYRDIWKAWPQTQIYTYWSALPSNLMTEVFDQNIPVCPALRQSPDDYAYLSFSSALIASNDSDQSAVLSALVSAGLDLVQPPPTVFELLSVHCFTPVEPINVRSALLAVGKLELLTDEVKDTLLKYLVLSPGGLMNIVGLPVVPLVDGSRVALHLASMGSPRVMVNEAEEQLFSAYDSSMIALSSLVPPVRKRFVESVNVAVIPFTLRDIIRCLNHRFADTEPTPEELISWMTSFWAWIWSGKDVSRDELFPLLGSYRLLPTVTHAARTLKDRIILSDGLVAPEVQLALMQLGVPILHSSVAGTFTYFTEFVLQATNLGFILDHIQPNMINSLDKHQILALRNHLSTAAALKPLLTPKQMQVLRGLPIFPTLQPGCNPVSLLGPAAGNLIYVAELCPLAVQLTTSTYIDTAAAEEIRALILLLNPLAFHLSLKEPHLLMDAIPILTNQNTELMDALVRRMLLRIGDFDEASVHTLKTTPFVLVNGGARVAPNNVVHPKSSIAELYAKEEGKFPDGQYKTSTLLDVFMSKNFFLHQLDLNIIAERIDYVSRSQDIMKARELFWLVERNWSNEFHVVISTSTAAWVPTKGPKKTTILCRHVDCRDDYVEHPYIFDQVLRQSDVKALKQQFRYALGWSKPLPFLTVLLPQVAATIQLDANQCAPRMIELLNHLGSRARREGDISPVEIDTMRETLASHAWVPISLKAVVPAELSYSAMSVRLDKPFFALSSRIDVDYHGMLSALGCLERPSSDALLNVLGKLSGKPKEAVRILEELASQYEMNIPTEDAPRLLIPDESGNLCQIQDIFYNDVGFASEDQQSTPCHSYVSRSLAARLQVPFLSALELGETADDIDDIDMGEDFPTRIKSVLREHSIEYALNEFIANAVDAGATDFKIILDQRSHERQKILAPALGDLQETPALILYNNKPFLSNDFDGLRKIGIGGKKDTPDSVGRFGLGALSMFHFTDLPMIVSGTHVMFLDPSGSYLPSRGQGKKRTALFRTIQSFARKYADHLAPFESLFGFDVTKPFSGTLFRLPLRKVESLAKSMSASACRNLIDGPYRELGYHAMFFTPLITVAAEAQPTYGKPTTIWEYQALAREPSVSDSTFHSKVLTVAEESGSAERWLITESITPLISVPAKHQDVLEKNRFTSTHVGITVKIALLLTETFPLTKKYHLFSTLQLPVVTSLPCHVHGQFVLASDRRNIRFDPADSSGNRVTDASYNAWLLESLVPPLFFYTLEQVVRITAHDNLTWWPRESQDDISSCITNEFYKALPSSDRQLCFNPQTRTAIAPRIGAFASNDAIHNCVICKLLVQLKVSDFIQLPCDIGKLSAEHLNSVTPAFLQRVIRQDSSAILEKLYPDKISVYDIDVIIRFLRDTANSTTVAGLPLFIDANKPSRLSNFPLSAIYYLLPGSVEAACLFELFDASQFLSPRYTKMVIEVLETDMNVDLRPFDAAAIQKLVRARIPVTAKCDFTLEDALWVQNFCANHSTLASPTFDISTLKDLPLLKIHGSNTHVSIDYCVEHCLLPPASGIFADNSWFPSVLQKLEIFTVENPPFTMKALSERRFGFKIFLEHIRGRENSLSTALANDEHRLIAQWLRRQLTLHSGHIVPGPTWNTLKIIPIWKASSESGGDFLAAACNISVLPIGIPISLLRPYLSNQPLAEYSVALKNLCGKLMNGTDLINALNLPPLIPATDLDSFKMLVGLIINHLPENLLVPNGYRILVPVNTLYDQSNITFARALSSTRMTSFLHEDLLPMQTRLCKELGPGMGLRFKVNYETFIACARVINTDVEDNRLDNIQNRAEAVYEAYRTILPREIMVNENWWQSLAAFRFIPRLSPRRRPLPTSYTAEEYCVPLGSILSPRQMVKEEYEAVAWTQRGLFLVQPPEELTAVHRSLGVPTAPEVVAHLVVLAKSIAVEHPGCLTLISDLHATYQWLNNNAEAARESLTQHESDNIFLNVDNPATEKWILRTAKSLVFNLHHDSAELVQIRNFVAPFKNLLMAAGAGDLADPQYVASESEDVSSPTDTDLRLMFNKLRKKGELTDIILVPTNSGDFSSTSAKPIRAHKSFLAATVPYFRDLFSSGMVESTTSKYNFHGTAFAAHAVLDFIYTGDLNIAVTGSEEMTNLLKDLLDTLEVAERFEMVALKERVQWCIAKKYEMVTPTTVDAVYKEAELYHAKSLLRFCDDFRRNNHDLLTRLSSDNVYMDI